MVQTMLLLVMDAESRNFRNDSKVLGEGLQKKKSKLRNMFVKDHYITKFDSYNNVPSK